VRGPCSRRRRALRVRRHGCRRVMSR
jgi:hypothetical protein